MDRSKLLVVALLVVLTQSCRTSTEPVALVAPGFRATINGVAWTADTAYAAAKDTSTNCMYIYGFSSIGHWRGVFVGCQKTVVSGDTISGVGTYMEGSSQYLCMPDSGRLVILSRTASNIQGRFYFTGSSGFKGSGPVARITNGEFNLDITY